MPAATRSRADRLRELRPFVAEAQRLQGWTLAYEPVALGAPWPWDYVARARAIAAAAGRVLDLGTGGGEVFADILAGSAIGAVATEAWPPNAPVAARRLRPRRAAVVQASSLQLPFAAERFDLVLDRHEELAPAEVARVLRLGGVLLTQQVRSDYLHELRAYFPRMTEFEPHERTYPQGLRAAGLEVTGMHQHARQAAFRSLGHLVYHLVAAPWTIPDFELERDLDALLAIEQGLGGPQGIVLSEGRYLLAARKPGTPHPQEE